MIFVPPQLDWLQSRKEDMMGHVNSIFRPDDIEDPEDFEDLEEEEEDEYEDEYDEDEDED